MTPSLWQKLKKVGKTTRPFRYDDGIKIARKITINLRYADDTILMAESKEELESPLMKVKEESEMVGLKLH